MSRPAGPRSVRTPTRGSTPDVLPDFHAVLEPIVALVDGRTVAHELLLRPRQGGSVASWHEGCDATEWRHFTRRVLELAGITLRARKLPLHVNVTALDLATPGFATLVAELVPETATHQLVLELTEQFPVVDGPTTTATLIELRRLGIRVAVDDYGEGWTGPATLRLISPDIVKVTVAMLEAGDPIRSAAEVHGLAHQIGASTVLEQIERTDQLAWALEAGFTHGQGWLWSGRAVRTRRSRHRSA